MKSLFFLFNIFITTLVFSQDSIVDYYNEIATKAEYVAKGDINHVPTRWNSDIKIFVKGNPDSLIYSELNKVIKELNDLINPIEIRIVNCETDANLIAFFGLCTDYDKIDPIVIPYSGYNFGLACLYSDNNNTWYKGSFYVDVVRCDWFPPNEAIQMKKHILREELTQSIGLLNDSMKYPNSIFYQGWTFPTEYTELDKEVIKRHYNQKN
jgi:hypothetical protein